MSRPKTVVGFCGWYRSQRLNLTEGAGQQLSIAVGQYARWLGHDPALTTLNRDDLLRWLRDLMADHSPATVNSKRRAIITLWRAAAEEGLCPWPPSIPRVLEPERLPVAWRLDEIESIFRVTATLTGQWSGVPVSLCWQTGLLVCWDTACRLGTLLKAELSHVDCQAQTWRVPAEHVKGRRGDRLFQLHEQTVATIRKTTGNGRTSTKLFPFPWQRQQVWRHYKRLLEAAGLPRDRTRMFHCLRRSAESWAAARAPGGIEWAANCVGHSVAVARKSYINLEICRPPSLIEVLPRPTFG